MSSIAVGIVVLFFEDGQLKKVEGKRYVCGGAVWRGTKKNVSSLSVTLICKNLARPSGNPTQTHSPCW